MCLDFLIYRHLPNTCVASGNSTEDHIVYVHLKAINQATHCYAIYHPRKTKFIFKILRVPYQTIVAPGQLASSTHSFLLPGSSFTMKVQCLKHSNLGITQAATPWLSLDHTVGLVPLDSQTLWPLGEEHSYRRPIKAQGPGKRSLLPWPKSCTIYQY